MKTNRLFYLIILIMIAMILKPNSLFSNAHDHENTEMPVKVYLPFNLQIDPMESLLLFTIENDPDTLYVGFEPQVFNDTVNGSGMLVIAWRKDGFVDVYHEASLTLDSAKYNIAGKGLANMVSTHMNQSRLYFGENGVDAAFSFHDIHGREIAFSITERSTRKRNPFGLLAPMGNAAENPQAMPMVLLHDFYFSRKNDTDFSLTINGQPHQPDMLPMRIDRQRMLGVRYSPDPTILTVNPARTAPVHPFVFTENSYINSSNNSLSTQMENGRVVVNSISVNDGSREIVMSLKPAIPDLGSIVAGERFAGKFEIEGHRSTGRVVGRYTIGHDGKGVDVHFHPSGGWKPRPDRFSVRFLYTMVSMFKNWPKTYHYHARIEKTETGQWHEKSRWVRE